VKRSLSYRIGPAVAALALAGCGAASSSGVPGVNVPSSPLNGKLQFAVGTANLFADDPSAATSGLNVVVTFRQPAGATAPGDSDALVNTPTLTLPSKLPTRTGTPDAFGATIETGPTQAEAGGSKITSTPQQNPGTPTIPPSTFGVSGGAFGLGFFPGNYSSVGSASIGTGVPDSLVPWTVPFYDPLNSSSSSGGDPNAFVPWGGPPAFDPDHNGKGTRDGTGWDPSVLGVSEGLDVFEGVTPAAGTYGLAVYIPTNGSSSGTVKATATLRSTALLPPVQVPTPALDGNGGATFAVTLPPGVTEAYVQIVDVGPGGSSSSSGGPANCNGASALPVYYTLRATGSGTLTLPDEDGPGSVVVKPIVSTPSLCTAAQNTAAAGAPTPADRFVVQTVAFDYPLYEASYPMSQGNPEPPIVGAAGQADLAVSSAVTFAPGSSGSGPATRLGVRPVTRIRLR